MKNYLVIMKKGKDMENKYDIGDIVLINDTKEYTIINNYNDYYVLLSNNSPIDILIGKINENNNLSIINDRKIVLEVLSNFKGEN